MTASSPSLSFDQGDRLCIDTLQMLCVDALKSADQGHSEVPASLVPVAYCLWKQFLQFDPGDPRWMNRDRFVLSDGQASVLLYALLHLCGVKSVTDMDESTGDLAVSLEDIKRFKQPGSRFSNSLEYGLVPGIEATAGLLGQGISMGVGMAIAQSWSAQHFNRPNFEIFDYRIYALCSKGDLMEGVASESAVIAGDLQLSNLCWIYDHCTTHSATTAAETNFGVSENVTVRFQSYGWQVIQVDDADDLNSLTQAFQTFRQSTGGPTLIVINTQRTQGEVDIKAMKQAYGQPADAEFWVPDGVRQQFEAHVGLRGRRQRDDWTDRFDRYQLDYPTLAVQLYQMQHRELPEQWDTELPEFLPNKAGVAGTVASAKVLSAISKQIPWVIGGSAEGLAENNINLNINFGIREHAMAAILNGLSLSKIRPYGSTQLVLSDYGRPAIRLSAMMRVPVIYIFTYNSDPQIEPGITQQTIEQLVSLRSIPDLIILRPADANEVVEAWWITMQLQHNPSVIVLPQQPMPTLDRNVYAPATGVHEGAYILADTPEAKPDVILLSTGSEVYLCVQAHEQLKAEGIKSRVVSMPSWELFEQQPQDYRNLVLPPGITARVSVESASTAGWSEYVGLTGIHLGKDSFNRATEESLSDDSLTVDGVVEAAKSQLANK